MAYTSVFGDASARYQRYGVIPDGGLSIECGCITMNVESTFYVPTHFSKCVAVLMESPAAGDDLAGIPDVSSGGHINVEQGGAIVGANHFCYVAFGF